MALYELALDNVEVVASVPIGDTAIELIEVASGGERDWVVAFPRYGGGTRYIPLHRGEGFDTLQDASNNLRRAVGDLGRDTD